MQLPGVVCTVVEAEDGGRAHGQADKHGEKDELNVHHHRVGRYPLAAQQLHKGPVVENGDKRGGDVGHQFGGAVGAALEQHFGVEVGLYQPESAGVGEKEVDQRDEPTHHVARHRSQGGSGHSPAQHGDEEIVQGHIGPACRQGEVEAHLGLFRSHAEALEGGLEHKEYAARRHDGAVSYAVAQQGLVGAQKDRQRTDKGNAQGGEDRAAHNDGDNEGGKILLGPLRLARSHDPGHLGGAAGAQHKAKGAQNHGQGIDNVYSRQGGVPHHVGNENAIHHRIDGGDDHHDDRGQGETEQAGISKVVGKLNPHKI